MSTKGIGRLIQFGAAKETTRGTAISSAAYWTPWMDLTLDEKKEFASDASAYGIIEDNQNQTQTKKWSAGSVQGNLTDQTCGLFFYSLFGGYAVSGSGPYTHTFTVDDTAQHQSLTLFLHDPLSGQDYNYANGMVEKMEITAQLKQFVQFNASVLAQSGAAQSSFSPSTTAENRFVPQYVGATFAPTYTGLTAGSLTGTGTCSTTVHVTALSGITTASLRVGMTVSGTNIVAGTTVAKIVSSSAFDLSVASTGSATSYSFGPAVVALKSFKLTINQNIEMQDVLTSLSPADFLNKEFHVEGTFECIWQNETDAKTYFMGPTPQAVGLTMTNTDVTLSGGGNPEYQFLFAKCTFTELGRPFKVKDLVYQTVKFIASYSLADTLMGELILTNSVSSY